MDWAEFFRMGGYAAYVWPSYAVTFAVVAGLVVWIVRADSKAARDLARLEAESRPKTPERVP